MNNTTITTKDAYDLYLPTIVPPSSPAQDDSTAAPIELLKIAVESIGQVRREFEMPSSSPIMPNSPNLSEQRSASTESAEKLLNSSDQTFQLLLRNAGLITDEADSSDEIETPREGFTTIDPAPYRWNLGLLDRLELAAQTQLNKNDE